MKKNITIIIMALASLHTYAQVITSDSLALVAIYNSTGGATWTHHENWLSGPVPTWFGVTVNNKRVTKLELCTDCYLLTSGNNMTGSIPPAIGDLTKITNIVMSGNTLTSNIPSEIGNLADLYWLDLAANNLSNNLPASIGNLVHLNSLLLAFNKLDGELPDQLGNLTSLDHLSLGWNSFTGNIPVEIGDLVNLKQLQLNNNQFNGSIPKEVGNLTGLFDLALQNNQLSGEIPKEIGDLTLLTSLTLYINNLTGSIPQEIGNLTNLYTLFLYSNQLTGVIPHEIGQLTSLTAFAAYNNQLSGALPDEMGNLTSLTMLSLYNNRLSDNLPSSLGNLVNLYSLSLSDNQFNGSLPSSLGALTNLDIIDVSNNQFSGVIPSSIGNLNVARYFVFDHNNFTGALPGTFSNLPSLQYLTLENNQLTDLPDLSGDTQLWHLSLQNNKLTFEDIEANVAINGISYLPQNVTFTTAGQHLTEGDTFTTSFTVGGSFNQYQWWKDGMAVVGGTQPTLTIPSVTLADAGSYELRITNTKVTDLLLVTDPVVLSVVPAPYSEVQVSNDTTTFLNNGELTFPQVVTGDTAETNLVISNTGTAPLIISSIIAGGDFSVSFIETLPVTLAPGASMDLLCRFTSTVDGTVTGSLSVTSDANQPVFLLNLVGISYTPPPSSYPEIQVSNDTTAFVNNGELTFTQVVTGDPAETNLVISNTGTAPLIISSIIAGGDFSVSFIETLPVTLAPGASMDLLCRFTSTVDGTVTGSLSITSDANQPVFLLNLVGTSHTPPPSSYPEIQVSNDTTTFVNNGELTFPQVVTGDTAETNLVISNTGTASLIISSIIAGGDFSVSFIETLPVTLAPGASMDLLCRFTSTVDGTVTGSLSITSDANQPVFLLNLVGTSYTPPPSPSAIVKKPGLVIMDGPLVLLNAADLSFPVTSTGTTQSKQLDVSNDGEAMLVIESLETTGDFRLSSTAIINLQPGEHRTVTIDFIPSQDGDRWGLLTILSNADSLSRVINLGGIGFTEKRSYVALDGARLIAGVDVAFEITEVGKELVKGLLLMNTGNTAVSIESIDVSGPFSIANDPDDLLEAGEKLEIKLAFVPDHVGDHNGSLTIRTNSDTPMVTFGLTGEGEADIEVYNIVTTRANGKNDFFEIRNIYLFPSNHVQIFDRWGNKVYSKVGYDNVNDTFRGVSDRGNTLPDGTYFYLIDKKNGSEQVTGFLVVRN